MERATAGLLRTDAEKHTAMFCERRRGPSASRPVCGCVMKGWVVMRHRHNGLQAWRRYHASRWLVAVGLVVLLTVSALGGAALTHAFPSRSASAQAIAPLPRPTGVKAEGDWFQLSHFNNKLPPADARQLALQQAAKLPVSRIGATVRNGAVNTTSPAGSWTPLGPQPINGGGVNVSGRITALAVNPSNSNDVWAGAADGGL